VTLVVVYYYRTYCKTGEGESDLGDSGGPQEDIYEKKMALFHITSSA
jgi:hypothetical protein